MSSHDAPARALDMLNAVRGLGKTEFRLADVYAHAETLARLHPQNKNVEPKIRQQLQILRDMKIITFLGRGRYGMQPPAGLGVFVQNDW